MNSLVSKLIKNSNISLANVYADSELIKATEEFAPIPIPMLNVALSGKWNGGLPNGITILAGPSKMGKTFIGLILVKAYLDKYPDSACIFLDSEFGAGKEYFARLDIDTNRVVHIPLRNIEEAKFALTSIYDKMERGEKVITFFDSIGNIASKKEMDDAIDGKSVQDMSRAKQLKSFFRIITPYINILNIPFVGINHTYQTTDFFPVQTMGGGCLNGNTKIQVDATRHKPIKELHIGDTVLSKDGISVVENVYTPEILGVKPCYEITFEDGTKIQCSEEHKFLVDNKWVSTKDIVVGDDCLTI